MVIEDGIKYECITFDYEISTLSNSQSDCDLYLNEEELQQVFEVLDANKNALFKDLPAPLYEAFREAAETCAINAEPPIGLIEGSEFILQKEMPEDLLELYKEHCEESCSDDLEEDDDLLPEDDDDQLPEEDVLLQMALKTKADLMAYIDSKMTQEDRDNIIKSDPMDLHFSYGMMLRNLLIYPGVADVEGLLEDNPQPQDDSGFIRLRLFHPDSLSSELIGEYKTYLLEKMVAALKPKLAKAADGPVMKCLAVRQPWAQLIVTGIKDIECRDAMPAPKKPKVFIAASGTKLRWDELPDWVQNTYMKYEKKGVLPAYDKLPVKCIVGYVDIVKSSFDPVESIWGNDWDGMKYTLRNAHVLNEPIRGKNKATPYFYNVDGYDENHLPPAHVAELGE